MCRQNAPMLNMRAFCWHTRKRFEPTHGDVLNLHTGRREGGFSYLSLVPSLFLSSPPFSLPSFFLLSFSRSLPLLSSLLSSLYSFLATMTMITRSVGSLCTQSSDLLECQCAWASVHSLLAEHVRSMQETTVLVFPVQASCHLE